MRPILLAAAALTLSLSSAAALEGRYRVEGSLPGGRSYAGEAVVRKSGEVYAIAWQTQLGRHVGTGILTGQVLSVVYRDQANREPPGIASFVVVDDRIAQGRWSTLGATHLGREAWTFQAER